MEAASKEEDPLDPPVTIIGIQLPLRLGMEEAEVEEEDREKESSSAAAGKGWVARTTPIATLTVSPTIGALFHQLTHTGKKDAGAITASEVASSIAARRHLASNGHFALQNQLPDAQSSRPESSSLQLMILPPLILERCTLTVLTKLYSFQLSRFLDQ